MAQQERICLQWRRVERCGFNPWVGKIPWRRKWQPTSSILAWEIPWTEEPSGLQSIGSQRVRHDWVTERVHARAHTHTHTHTHSIYLPINYLYSHLSFYSSSIKISAKDKYILQENLSISDSSPLWNLVIKIASKGKDYCQSLLLFSVSHFRAFNKSNGKVVIATLEAMGSNHTHTPWLFLLWIYHCWRERNPTCDPVPENHFLLPKMEDPGQARELAPRTLCILYMQAEEHTSNSFIR